MDSCDSAEAFLNMERRCCRAQEVQPNDDPLALNSNSERAEVCS